MTPADEISVNKLGPSTIEVYHVQGLETNTLREAKALYFAGCARTASSRFNALHAEPRNPSTSARALTSKRSGAS